MKRLNLFYGIFAILLLVGLPFTSFAGTPPEKAPASNVAAIAVPPISTTLTDCPVASRFTGEAGIYAKNLKTGQVITLKPDDIFAAASTIKVPVSIVVYKHFYDQAGPDTRQVYDTGVELMMTISDNDYFADFLDEIEEAIGPEKIRQHFSLLGMTHTTIRDPQARNAFGYSNVTTAQDMALIFEQLYRGKLLNAEKTAFMLDGLSHSIFPDELARYMQNRRVIHKIGELDDVLADVGIVEGPNGPILISIFTETPQDIEYASDYIAAMSACLYTRLSGEKTAWSGPAAI